METEISFKTEWNFHKNLVKYSQKLSEIFFTFCEIPLTVDSRFPQIFLKSDTNFKTLLPFVKTFASKFYHCRKVRVCFKRLRIKGFFHYRNGNQSWLALVKKLSKGLVKWASGERRVLILNAEHIILV